MPAVLTSFIGREHEISRIEGILRHEETRLLTLAGFGGAGKTRIALKIGESLSNEYRDGAVFVGLEGIENPSLVPTAIAEALGIEESGYRSTERILVEFLAGKNMLLIIDNFEHVMPSAPLLAALLKACRRLTMLVTSRETLRVRGEVVFRVPPLSIPEDAPTPEEMTDTASYVDRYEALRLFVERAVAADPGFVVTSESLLVLAETCRRLDGIPLAIELAVPRISILGIEGIYQRIGRTLPLLNRGARDLPERHRTMERAIAWSYDLLSRDEQKLFRLLGVFSGGCTIEAIEAVCLRIGIRNSADLIVSLVDKNLLGCEETQMIRRFSMPTVLREYALRMLISCGEEREARLAHARYYLELAEKADARRGEIQTWEERLRCELANFRATHEWLLGAGEPELLYRMAGALYDFLNCSCATSETHEWLEKTIATPGEVPPVIRAKVIRAAGSLDIGSIGKTEEGLEYLRESVDLFEEAGDERETARSLLMLALWTRSKGDVAESVRLIERVIAMSRETTDDALIGEGLQQLSESMIQTGELEKARDLLEESLRLLREVDDPLGVAKALADLGIIEHRFADDDAATKHYDEGFQLLPWDRLESRGVAGIYRKYAGLALDLGRIEEAKRIFTEILSRSPKTCSKLRIGRCCAGLGHVAFEEERLERATRLFSFSFEQIKKIGLSRSPQEKSKRESCVARLRERLGEERYAALEKEGRSMSDELAVLYALESYSFPDEVSTEHPNS